VPHQAAIVIVNPIAGTGRRPAAAARRLALASELARGGGTDVDVVATTGPGHAHELATAAVARGARVCVAWGGDGTVNEVAAALVRRDAALGIVPAGSGNGLARELGIPSSARAAFDAALSGRERTIDCGELGGRLFVNVAGIGLDARVAHAFAASGRERRGFVRYVAMTLRELFASTPEEHTIRVDETTFRTRALIVAVANGRQYGNGVRIAPHARLDDGRLDVVVIEHRAAWRALLETPLLFAGQTAHLAGVRMLRGTHVELTSAGPTPFHVDGEPLAGSSHLVAKVHALALRVRVPAG
jgi:YegS/Rv2252/BmrU family lipid kinase